MYDAASNGHLEVVKLLLDKGAIPSLKTDFGETPLHVLQKWRAGTILTKDEETLYKNICNKIHCYIDKSNVNDTILNRSKSKTPVKGHKDVTPPSTSKPSSKKLDSPAIRRRNIIEDDSSDDDINISQIVKQKLDFDDDSNDSDVSHKSKHKDANSGVKEYRNAISALRNRNATEITDVEVKKKTKPALLNPDEVDDDWLDDDIGTNKNKKRKLSDPLTTVAKKPSYDNIKESIENINRTTEPLVENNKNKPKKNHIRISDVIDISENSNSSDSNENICPKMNTERQIVDLNDSRNKDSRDSMRRRWKRQSTLLRAGFQRKRGDDSSNSGSENDYSRQDYTKLSLSRKKSSEGYVLTRKSSGENFNTNLVNNLNIVQPVNVIQPISIVQSNKNGRAVQTQILQPPAVKVHVEDKVFLISLKLDSINRLTISWLVEEVKTRYYK